MSRENLKVRKVRFVMIQSMYYACIKHVKHVLCIKSSCDSSIRIALFLAITFLFLFIWKDLQLSLVNKYPKFSIAIQQNHDSYLIRHFYHVFNITQQNSKNRS